ncbi:hypothetical protein P7K49_015553 [Saguinus oedipus]|uniref:Uncharacterized protein n=1 Tax=Saguinus oedipus TaxID=9490 RepID=A0ABQ9V9J1_SAGOE|nr:hypothetical protein P7K49_015553 [Saguinus oedipus]
MIQPAACTGPAAGREREARLPPAGTRAVRRRCPRRPRPRAYPPALPRTHDALLGVLGLGDDHGRAARFACSSRPRRALAPAGDPVELQAVFVAAAAAAAAATAALRPLALPARRAAALPGPGASRAVARARLLPGRRRRRLLPGHSRGWRETRGSGAQWTGYKLRGGRGAETSHPASTSSPALPKVAAAGWAERGRVGRGNRAPPWPRHGSYGESRRAAGSPRGNPLEGEWRPSASPQVRFAHKASQLQPGPPKTREPRLAPVRGFRPRALISRIPPVDCPRRGGKEPEESRTPAPNT